MSLIRRAFSRIAAIATMITAAIPINAISSSSSSKEDPISAATRFHTLVFFLYVVILVLAAIFQWWVWSTNNRLQDAIRKDSDARIAEAAAATVKLENENLILTGQISKLQIDASDAKAEQQRVQTALVQQEGKTAVLERAASDAKAAQQKVEKELAVQQERAAIAEKELLDVKERLKPRHLTPTQQSSLFGLLKDEPKGEITMLCVAGDKESCDFVKDIANVLAAVGWKVIGPNPALIVTNTGGPPVGLVLSIANGVKDPHAATALQQALGHIGFSTTGEMLAGMKADELRLTVGVKP
jgi:hypothetical protein